jgi:hypothetical protein
MALTYPRIQAGEYQINDGRKMVGYIKKQNASKWILYKCSNPALLGSPISVQKTLKSLKVDAENMIGSTETPDVEITENSTKLESLLKDVRADKSEKYEVMKEMLEHDYVIKLNEYEMTEDGLQEVNLMPEDFLTQEELEIF